MTTAEPIRSHRLRWAPALALVALLVIVLALAWRGSAAAQEPEDATIWFTHSAHLAADIPCAHCHPGVYYDTQSAGLPSTVKCVGCHSAIDGRTDRGRATITAVREMLQTGAPMRWERVYDIPGFVYFIHQPHIAGGVACARCHGDLSRMELARPAYRINMGFCLNCHRDQPAEKHANLTRCWTCHQ